MRFDFFTFGGGHYWEDVFFYQKWRIQRNYKSKGYRLLDPWDIRRHEGTFEDCRVAFVKFIDVYEIARQKGHMIIMIHGLADTKNVFKPLWRAALQAGFMAAAVNYPSTLKQIDTHVRQLDFLLNNLEDVNEVSFVTKGVGGLVLRKLLSQKSSWQDKLKISKIVQVSPPNKGSKLFGKLSGFAFFRWILGPILKEASPSGTSKIPDFPKNLNVGVVYCDYPFKDIASAMPKSFRDLLPKVTDTALPSVKDTKYVKNLRVNPFNNKKVVSAVVNYLRKGKFD